MYQMSGGQFNIPMVFRGPTGSAGQLGAQHSQAFENWYANCPGLKVVVPSNPYDAKGLLKTAIRDNDPVIFMESEQMYGEKGEVPEEEYLIPIGKADIKREDTVINSVKKTNRLVIVEEAWPLASISTEITYMVQKNAFDHLDAPIRRICTQDTPLGYAPTFVEEFLPNIEKTIKAVKEVLYR
jgi:pyruvate dehydrogenase E1 component beta subunit